MQGKIDLEKEENSIKEIPSTAGEFLRGEKREGAVFLRLALVAVCAMILGLGVGFIFSGKREFSESENRPLAAMPVFTMESLKDGTFTQGLADHVSDQFPFRDGYLGIMTEAERLSGQKEISGVYISRDPVVPGQTALINAYTPPKNPGKAIAQFTKLAEKIQGQRMFLMLVPTAVEIYHDTLPAFAPYQSGAQEEDIRRITSAMPENVLCVDALESLRGAAGGKEGAEVADGTEAMGSVASKDGAEAEAGDGAKRLYYRTDHHWTTHGAYVGYKAFCAAAGLIPENEQAYDTRIVSTDFRGTIYSKLNDPAFGADSIVSYSSPAWKLQVSYEDTGEVRDTPYAPEYLKQRDQYSYFLNNIHPLVVITNEAVGEEAGALVLVKDSYANSCVPFLLGHYRTIYILDTRYYKKGPSSFIREHKDVKDVLVLYNMGTLDTDAGVGGIY